MTETVEVTNRMRYPTEKDFMDHWASVAEGRGWLVYHTHDSRRSGPGFPDLVLLRDGYLIVAECKMARYVRTPNKGEAKGLSLPQVVWLDAFRLLEKKVGVLRSLPPHRALVQIFVWTPDDEDEMARVLE